jgi:hypothetical protein
MDVWFNMDIDGSWLSDSFECIADPAGEKPVVFAEQVLESPSIGRAALSSGPPQRRGCSHFGCTFNFMLDIAAIR